MDPLKIAEQITGSAISFFQQKKYSEAENLLQQAIEIQLRELGENDSDYAVSLGTLAMVYSATANYQKSFPLYRQAIDILKKNGNNDLNLGMFLSCLGEEFIRTGTDIGAAMCLEEALEVLGRTAGKDHEYYAFALDSLAAVYVKVEDYSKAEPLIRHSLKIMQRKLEKNDHAFAVAYTNLANVCLHTGKYVDAESFYKQALDVVREQSGEDDAEYASILKNLAKLYAVTDRHDKGMELLEKTINIHDKAIGTIFSCGSESQSMNYLDDISDVEDMYVSYVLQFFSHDKKALSKALDLILKRKGLATEAMAIQRDVLHDDKYLTLREKTQRLSDLRMQVGKMILSNPGPRFTEYQRELETLTAKKDLLELELARQIPEIKMEKIFTEVDHAKISAALPEFTVLIEFVHFSKINFKSMSIKQDPPHYLAFILKSSDPNDVNVIDLGETEQIDGFLSSYKQSITSKMDNKMSSNDDLNVGHLLRKSVFDPLKPFLENCKKIFLAVEGNLTQIPFEVLPSSGKKYLIDDYHFCYLSTGRDILRYQINTNEPPGTPLVLADPDFDLGPSSKKLDEKDDEYDFNKINLKFGRLDGTYEEGVLISDLLKVKPWLGKEVLEQNLKSCKSPRILHMATHGFFLPDNPERGGSDKDIIVVVPKGGGNEILRYKKIDPLIRSGLALAGANKWNQSDLLPSEAEDGILTATDVTGLDLHATDLVVLSACETGVGEVHVSEGVFGLRRAFVLAGAKTLVMSLWKVPDKETQDLMLEFYENLLDGQSRDDALRNAALKIKNENPKPLYWGAFICQGKTDPIYNIKL